MTLSEKESIEYFERKLRNEYLSPHTIKAYVYSVRDFQNRYSGEICSQTLRTFRAYLVQHYKPRAAQARIVAVNKWLKISGHTRLKIKCVNIPRRPFIENVISDAEYKKLLRYLQEHGERKYYFIVRLLASTGARISEFCCFKIEDLAQGYADLYGKREKYRRIYIPDNLRTEIAEWVAESGRTSGALFQNYAGRPIKPRGVGAQLKILAIRAGLSGKSVYPHSFRHFFAKKFPIGEKGRGTACRSLGT